PEFAGAPALRSGTGGAMSEEGAGAVPLLPARRRAHGTPGSVRSQPLYRAGTAHPIRPDRRDLVGRHWVLLRGTRSLSPPRGPLSADSHSPTAMPDLVQTGNRQRGFRGPRRVDAREEGPHRRESVGEEPRQAGGH